MRLLLLVVAAFSGVLSAQVALPFSGSVGNSQQSAHLLAIDFGAGGTAGLDVIDVVVSGDSAASGMQVTLVDLDDLAQNGPTSAVAYGSDAGTGQINISLTRNLTGVHRFAVAMFLLQSNGVASYSGSISAGAPVVSITELTTQVIEDDGAQLKVLFGVSVNCAANAPAGDSSSLEFLVDFGAAKSITFWIDASGTDTGSIEVFEIFEISAATGLPADLAPSAGLSGVGPDWNSESNFTTGIRSGQVRFRVVGMSAPGMDFRVQCVFPSSVNVVAVTHLTFVGTLAANQQRYHRFAIDLGSVATSLAFMRLALANSSNVYVIIIDLDEVATNGPAFGFGNELPFQTAAAAGTHQFMIVVGETSGIGGASFDVEVGVAVPASAVTDAGTAVVNADDTLAFAFDRAARKHTTFAAAGTQTSEFELDFGPSANTAAFWMQAGGSAAGAVEVFEVSGSGPAVLLQSLALTGGSEASVNGATNQHSGRVRIRVVVTATTAGDLAWAVIFHSSVRVGAVSPKKHSGDDDGGCSTGGRNGNLLLLLAALGLSVVGLRVRRARAS